MALYCVYRMWRSFSKRRAFRILVIAVNFLLCVFLLFQSLWGLNYSRLPLKESLQLDVHPRPAQEVYDLAVWHVTKANQLCAGLDTEALPPQLDLWSGYENLSDAYAVFSRVKGRAKPLISSVFSVMPVLLASIIHFWLNRIIMTCKVPSCSRSQWHMRWPIFKG